MKHFFYLVSVFASFCITSCSFFVASDMHRQRSFIESATVHNRPISEPVRAISSFSDSLGCMDNMLRENHIPQTIIASKAISDASNKAPVAAKEMIITALSQMSRTSHAFLVVDVEVDPLSQDTVQTLTNILLPSGQMTIPKPSTYISGSISYVDQNVLLKEIAAGVTGKRYELGISNDLMVSAIGLDLHIGDFSSRTLFPGIDSSNEITAANKGIGFDSGAEIRKTGVQFSFGGGNSQGVGPAIRTLIDLGMIELIGKWAKIPYWQCLALDQAHPEFQRQLYSWYSGMSSKEKIRFFQTGLKGLGYYKGDVSGTMSQLLKDALVAFQADYRAIPSGNINFEGYERLISNYVVSDGNGKFLRIGWKHNMNSAQYVTGLRKTMPEWGINTPKPVDISISLDRDTPHFSLGESLQLNISVNRMSYLSCFYQDAKGNIAQIYPSMFQPPMKLQANHILNIPDNSDPYSFTLEMTSKGNESIACLAYNEDPSKELSEILSASSLESIRKFGNMEQLIEALQENMKDKIQGVNSFNWTVGY